MKPETSPACICARLRRAARAATQDYDAALAPLGVNVAQYSLLRHIQRAAPVNLTDLAALMQLDASTLGRNLRVLDKNGWTRAATGRDRRARHVALTDTGRDVLNRAAPLWRAAQDATAARLGAEGQTALFALLDALDTSNPQPESIRR
ncbi:MAG: MarR family winged helix-turn-helix transcriptional regulator [Rhodobacteraceae bacterium]|nr:MarR family winged helix-turn-helix transcriptional regulator [Paracoccaceae bacterium]